MPSRAVDFYKNALGWDIMKWEGPDEYWLATTGADSEPGINGAIMPGTMPQVVLTIDVDDIDKTCQMILDAGGKHLTEKQEVMNVGIMRYCQDTEGNKFAIMQSVTPMPEQKMTTPTGATQSQS
jgi:hypothetical protein